jgi:hypothetical protein
MRTMERPSKCARAHTVSRMRSWHQLTQQATVRSLAGELRIMISTQEAHAQPQAVSSFLFAAVLHATFVGCVSRQCAAGSRLTLTQKLRLSRKAASRAPSG